MVLWAFHGYDYILNDFVVQVGVGYIGWGFGVKN
jgi:hypothetical protein